MVFQNGSLWKCTLSEKIYKWRWNQYQKTRMMADVCLFRFENRPTNIASNNKSGTIHTRQKSRNHVFTYENRPCQSMSWFAVVQSCPISTNCHPSPTIATKHHSFTQWLRRSRVSPLPWWPGQRPWPGRRRSWPRGAARQQTEMFSVLRKGVERPKQYHVVSSTTSASTIITMK